MTGIFRLTYPAPLMVPVGSRQCCSYMNRAMMFVGWQIPERGIRRYFSLLWQCFVFAFSTVYLPIGFTISLILEMGNFTPGEFLSLLEISLNATGGMLKIFIVQVFLWRLRQTESLLDKLDEQLQSMEDHRKIHKAVAQCNNVVLIYAKIYLGYTVSALIAALITGQPPWLIYNPFFDWRLRYEYFLLQLVFEYIIGTMAVIIQLVVDTYTIVFIIIFRAHIEILKDHISHLRRDPFRTEAENYEELVDCIIYHKLILDCCNLLRPVISGTIFVQLLLIGIVLGVTLINVLYFSGIFRGISSILFLTAVLLETFPFCYLCDLLVEDCAEFSNTLGQSHWLGAEPRYKSTLRIFMYNVQQPIVFIAGGIFSISMNNNIKMAKFAFTVMTIVKELNLAERFDN